MPKYVRERIFHNLTSPPQLDMGGRSTKLEIWTDILPQELVEILSENALDTDSDDDEENIRVTSLLNIIYDDGDDDFEDNCTALAN